MYSHCENEEEFIKLLDLLEVMPGAENYVGTKERPVIDQHKAERERAGSSKHEYPVLVIFCSEESVHRGSMDRHTEFTVISIPRVRKCPSKILYGCSCGPCDAEQHGLYVCGEDLPDVQCSSCHATRKHLKHKERPELHTMAEVIGQLKEERNDS